MAISISYVGSSAGDGTTITIPVGHATGDLMIIYAFRSATTAPTLPAGWTNVGNASAGASSYRVGGRIAASGAESSGTWTNATGLIVAVYRNATNTFFLDAGTVTATSTTLTYGDGTRYREPQTSWAVNFGAIKTTTTLATAPSGSTNRAATTGAANAYAIHDTNGINTDNGAYTARTVGVGASAEWRTATLELQLASSLPNNYQFVRVGDGMSASEKIR